MSLSAGAWNLAQLNVAKLLHPLDDPRLEGFVSRLNAINALAEASPGFVWRLLTEAGNTTNIELAPYPDLIINMSVWQSPDALFNFTYKSDHSKVMAQRRQWFGRPDGPYQVLWWVAAGHEPSVAEAMDRLALLAANGPGPEAFTLKQRFAFPGVTGAQSAIGGK